MLQNVLLLALAGAVLWALFASVQGRPAFVVKITRGELRVAQGTVTSAFLQETRQVCMQHGVQNGWVRGITKDGRIALEFSGSMPAQCRQQLRNVWVLSGWTPKSRKTAAR